MIIGIDTGGTNTDGVLVDTEKGKIINTSKSLTTHDDLSVGIRECLKVLLKNQSGDIERIMLSTTLATNAVVRSKGQRVGLIFIGKRSHGILPTEDVAIISGKVNTKGREIAEIDEAEINEALSTLDKNVDAIAISGFMSVRNPAQEAFVREYINKRYNYPIVCGHELSTELGFHERTVTAILNAGLLPIISEFLVAIETVLKELNIETEIYIVRGDGSIVEASSIINRPVETILSGPTASVIGARYLTGEDECIICDMGGTTTDTSYMSNGEVPLTEAGAKVGEWKTMILSLDIHTYGLGGDSKITVTSDGDIEIGPDSAKPVCRGGDSITPTDVLHCIGDFRIGDKEASISAINKMATSCGIPVNDLVEKIESKIVDLIQEECITPWNKPDVPVVATGAAANVWLNKWNKYYGKKLIVPTHYEVANAVGAAKASIRETATAIIRNGEQNYGYIVHLKSERHLFMEKDEAIHYALKLLKKEAMDAAELHGGKNIEISTDRHDIYTEDSHKNNIYVETKIKVTATGKSI